MTLLNRLPARAERVSVSQEGQEEARKNRQKVRRTFVSERENRAHVLRSHVWGLAMLRRWRDGQGRNVGFVDHNGLRIQAPIQQALLRMGALTQVDDSLNLPENVERRLREACGLMDPAIFGEVKRVINPVEETLSDLKKKIVNLEENPDYLFQFQKGGSLRSELAEILQLMRNGRQTGSEVLQENPWVISSGALAHFPDGEELNRKMILINQEQESASEWEKIPTEYLAQFWMQENLRAEILRRAVKRKKPMQMARRMPGLIAGDFDLLNHGIAGQAIGLFGNQAEELGETDAESMCITLNIVNRCLLALIDIRRTKQVIPALT